MDDLMTKIKNIADLKPDKKNANKGTQRGRGMVEASLRETGAGRSIVVDKDGRIIAGNKTLEAWADIAGADDVVIVPTDGTKLVVVQRQDLDLNDDTGMARKLAIYDNRAGEVGLEWDLEELSASMQNGLDLSPFWNDDEMKELFDGFDTIADDPPAEVAAQVDRAEELGAKWATAEGQIWRIGEHVVICGDCREPATWQRLLQAANVDKVNGVFTSPPYAMQRKDQYGGVPTSEYVDWWEALQANVKANLAADGSFFVNIKEHTEDGSRTLYVFDLVCAMVRRWGWLYRDDFRWTHGGMPGDAEIMHRFKNQHEPIYWFASADKFKFRAKDVRHESDNAVLLSPGNPGLERLQGKGSAMVGAKTGRGLAYPGNVISVGKNTEDVGGHAAAFPVALPDFFVRAYSDPGDVWVDPFLGSGTTIVAAHNNKRRGLGSEKLPKYLGVILERLQEVVGVKPELI
jgi:DNA modification methylase